MLNWIFPALAVALPLAVYSGMAVREKVIVAGIVKAANAQCNAHMQQAAGEANRRIAAAALEAKAAADMIEPTPEEAAALQALCNRSASCRDHKKGD